jgi:hypothetical protein
VTTQETLAFIAGCTLALGLMLAWVSYFYGTARFNAVRRSGFVHIGRLGLPSTAPPWMGRVNVVDRAACALVRLLFRRVLQSRFSPDDNRVFTLNAFRTHDDVYGVGFGFAAMANLGAVFITPAQYVALCQHLTALGDAKPPEPGE